MLPSVPLRCSLRNTAATRVEQSSNCVRFEDGERASREYTGATKSKTATIRILPNFQEL